MMREDNLNKSGDGEDEATLLDDKIVMGGLVAKKKRIMIVHKENKAW